MRAQVCQSRHARSRLEYPGFSLLLVCALAGVAWGQTDCADGNGTLDNAPLNGISTPELIQKFAAQETKVREARSQDRKSVV